jgi:outer membrane lipoprotein-sorting protein
MRRMKWVAAIVVCVSILIAGCGTKNAETVVKDLDKVLGGMESYQGKGTMTLHTGAQPLEYQVEVWYKKPQYYRIALTNAKKDITQIVLRNDDGVFVLTPKLNKSFRFQSDWPQNQGQVYLYQTLVQSILLDNSRQFAADENAFVFDVMANYQNGSLARQKIWLSKDDYAPQKVEVSDSSANVMVEVKFDSFEFDAQFDAKAFDMAYNMSANQQQGGADAPTTVVPETDGADDADGADQADPEADPADQADQADDANDAASSGNDGTDADDASEDAVKEGDAPSDDASSDEQATEEETSDSGMMSEFVAMEPSYLPEGVSLKDMSEVVFGGEEGIMMRYTGTYDYTLLQTQPEDMDAAYVPGLSVDLGHTMGLLTGEEQQTLIWTYDGYEYRLTTGSLPEGEMIKVAQSVMSAMEK